MQPYKCNKLYLHMIILGSNKIMPLTFQARKNERKGLVLRVEINIAIIWVETLDHTKDHGR